MKTKILHWQFMWAVLATAALPGALGAQQQEPQQPPPAAAPQAQPARTDGDAPATKPRAGKIVLPAGTRLPLVLHNAITTRNAKPGDGVYLETLFPITQENRVIVPAGSYVQGEILEAKRPRSRRHAGRRAEPHPTAQQDPLLARCMAPGFEEAQRAEVLPGQRSTSSRQPLADQSCGNGR